MTKLPEKLSDLMELALADLAKCEAQPDKFAIYMGEWLSEEVDGVCSVCFAGAMMVQTMKTSDAFDKFTMTETRAMFALDDVRKGYVTNALEQLKVPDPYTYEHLDRERIHYEDDPVAWRQQMNGIILNLRNEGL